jgi:hypothetical protein
MKQSLSSDILLNCTVHVQMRGFFSFIAQQFTHLAFCDKINASLSWSAIFGPVAFVMFYNCSCVPYKLLCVYYSSYCLYSDLNHYTQSILNFTFRDTITWMSPKVIKDIVQWNLSSSWLYSWLYFKLDIFGSRTINIYELVWIWSGSWGLSETRWKT